MKITKTMKTAMETYKARLVIEDKPVGVFDHATKQWLPSKTHGEWQPCCTAVFGTESDNGYMLIHCHSARHVGMLHGLTGKELQNFVEYAACIQFDQKLEEGEEWEDVDDEEAYT